MWRAQKRGDGKVRKGHRRREGRAEASERAIGSGEWRGAGGKDDGGTAFSECGAAESYIRRWFGSWHYSFAHFIAVSACFSISA